MLQITKIFRFEMAHAINGCESACQHIHGHSYRLYVTVSLKQEMGGYLRSPGYILDFKELKRLTTENIIKKLDHKLLLSNEYIAKHPEVRALENLVCLEAEPTAENLLIYMQQALTTELPAGVKLTELKLYETAESYATWTNTTASQNKFPKKM